MQTVARILETKGRDVATARGDESVLEAARRMNERHIGSLVVVDEQRGAVVGILTERDLLTRVVAAQRDPRSTLVKRVMTSPVTCCGLSTTVEELRHLMRTQRIRHVPVREGERLVGLVSIGDVNAADSRALADTIVSLEEYIARA